MLSAPEIVQIKSYDKNEKLLKSWVQYVMLKIMKPMCYDHFPLDLI